MKARIHIKKDSLYNSFQHDKKTIENTFIERKRKISSDINSSDFEFLSLQISKKRKKKNYEIFSLLLGRKNFQNFHAQKERERNVIIITSHKKEAKGKKREKREAKVRNASVIGLCIFHAETFRRRSPKQKEEEMKREREREKQTRGKVRHGFGSRVVVVESSEPSQNRERAKKSCLAAITRPGAKGSNRKSTRSGVCHACGS